MNVNYEQIDPCNAVISIALVEDDYSKGVKQELARLAQRRPIKGFRPGHVPASLLQRQFGGEAKAYVVDRIVSEQLANYLKENKVAVLGEPMLSEGTKVDLNTEKEFEFRFDIGLKPEINVTCDSSVAVPYYLIDVTDEMVDKQIEMLCQRNGRQVPGDVSEADSMLRGSMAELDENGNEKEGGITVESTIVMPSRSHDEEQKNAMIGVEVGQTITINPAKIAGESQVELASMLNIDKEQAKDIKSDFKFYINEIMVHRPAEIGQELFDEVLGTGEVDNEEDFRAKVREMISRQYVGDSNYRFTIDVRRALEENVGEVALPDAFLKRFLLSRNEKATAEQIESEYPQARQQLIWQLIQDQVATKLDVKVTEEDMLRTARFMTLQQMAQYGIGNMPDEILDRYAHQLLEKDENHEAVAQRAFDDSLYAALKDAVTLTEQTVSVEEFQALFAKEEPMPEQTEENEAE